jgi:hypothetical protein
MAIQPDLIIALEHSGCSADNSAHRQQFPKAYVHLTNLSERASGTAADLMPDGVADAVNQIRCGLGQR